MPYCPECGEGVEDGFMFCPECGHDIDAITGERAGEGSRPGASDESAGAPHDAETERHAGTDEEAWGATSTDVGNQQDGPAAERSAATTQRSAAAEPADPIPTAGDGTEGDETPVERTTNVDGESPFTDGPFSLATGYATRRSRDPVVIGGIIEFAGLFIPFISLMVRGFGFRVATALSRGQTEPPEFDDYGEMFIDGLRVFGLGFVFVFAFGLVATMLGFGGYYVHEIVGVLLALAVLGAGFYLFPASLTAYAAHGTIGHALSPSYAGAFAFTTTYLKAYLVYILVSFGVSFIFTIAIVTIIGILALPFLIAWSMYAYASVWGYYYREAVEHEKVPPAPAEPV